MSLASFPRMLLSETDGWSDVIRLHPSVGRLLLFFVAPMSLIPAVMYGYTELVQPGVVFSLVEPALSVRETVLVALLFFAAELAMVWLMGIFIQNIGDSLAVAVPFERAFTLAAIAPSPLWLSSLALFIPSLWINVLALSIAWIGSAALIRHGVGPLAGLNDAAKAHKMASLVTVTGVLAWIAVMIVLGLLLSLVLGLR